MTHSHSVLLAFLIAAAGCSAKGDLEEPAPLPAAHAAATAGGLRLDLDTDGTLVSRSPCDDFEAALGASLAPVTSGVRVTSLLRAECPLRPGDVIVHARPLDPRKPDKRLKLRGLAPVTSSSYAVRRTRRKGHPVRDLSDLSGYARSWVQLDLLVKRGGALLRVSAEIGRPQPVALRLWKPELTLQLGFTVAQVDALPPRLVPTHAKTGRGDLLVVRVAVDSPAGVGGLRPLMVIPGEGKGDPGKLIGYRRRVLRPDGERIRVAFPRPDDKTAISFFYVLLTVENDANNTLVRVGPSWAKVFEVKSRAVYNPRTDRYGKSWGWSLADETIVAGGSGGAGRGSQSAISIGLQAKSPDFEVEAKRDDPFFSGPFIFKWD